LRKEKGKSMERGCVGKSKNQPSSQKKGLTQSVRGRLHRGETSLSSNFLLLKGERLGPLRRGNGSRGKGNNTEEGNERRLIRFKTNLRGRVILSDQGEGKGGGVTMCQSGKDLELAGRGGGGKEDRESF